MVIKDPQASREEVTPRVRAEHGGFQTAGRGCGPGSSTFWKPCPGSLGEPWRHGLTCMSAAGGDQDGGSEGALISSPRTSGFPELQTGGSASALPCPPPPKRARISSLVQTVFAYLQEWGAHFLTAPSDSRQGPSSVPSRCVLLPSHAGPSLCSVVTRVILPGGLPVVTRTPVCAQLSLLHLTPPPPLYFLADFQILW